MTPLDLLDKRVDRHLRRVEVTAAAKRRIRAAKTVMAVCVALAGHNSDRAERQRRERGW